MLCVLSALLGCQGMGAFRNMLHTALDAGIEPAAVKEVLYQAAAYLGSAGCTIFCLPQTKSWSGTVSGFLAPQRTTDENTRFEKGLAKQVALFGERMAKRQTDAPPLRRNITAGWRTTASAITTSAPA